MNHSESLPQIQGFQREAETKTQNYHQLMKMKKLLLDTEKKMFNRIKLFQKASEKILKKKQHELKMYERLENIKNDPVFSRTKNPPKIREDNRPKTRQQNRASQQSRSKIFQRTKENYNPQLSVINRATLQDQQMESRRLLVDRLNQTRFLNAKTIKQDRQRNKIIIQQRRKKQLSRKLQSASLIRRQRQKAKTNKEQMFRDRQQDCQKVVSQKFQRQKIQFMRLQQHLAQLQQQQKQALVQWKKTVQN